MKFYDNIEGARMKTLFIFGNGFDLAHDIDTAYSSFRAFLSKNHEEFLTQFERMYNIEPLDDTEPWYTEEAQKRWKKSVLKDLWKSFEEEIGKPNVDAMHDMAEALTDGMPEEGIKDTLDAYWREEYGFSRNFQKYVLEWLETIDTSGATVKKKDLVGDETDLFMNFNYTDTLERVYGIKGVLHIHGGIPSCTDTPPIMGHGNKDLITMYREKAKAAQEEFVEWEESICNAVADYEQALYKDTEKIITNNEGFFSSLSDIESVVCLGLSFGDVDIPYLKRIEKSVRLTTKWVVYYYNTDSLENFKSVFKTIGISNKYDTIFLQSDSFWDE